jgi:Fur family ferric uptake transcriptional regulator
MSRAPSQTRQRDAIALALERGGGPLTAEEVLERARPFCARLGIRTVFRNLTQLVHAGRLVKVSFPGQPPRYEIPASKHHPHLICWRCNQVFDLPGETPEVASRCSVPPGFIVQGEEVVLYGWCPACAPLRQSSERTAANAAFIKRP